MKNVYEYLKQVQGLRTQLELGFTLGFSESFGKFGKLYTMRGNIKDLVYYPICIPLREMVLDEWY